MNTDNSTPNISKPIFRSNPSTRFTAGSNSEIKMAMGRFIDRKFDDHFATEIYSVGSLCARLKLVFGEDSVDIIKDQQGTTCIALPNLDFEIDKNLTIKYYATNCDGWGQEEREVFEVVEFLKFFNDQVPSIIKRVMKDYEKNIKAKKIKELNNSTIKSLVNAHMEGTGFRYKLNINRGKARLHVVLRNELYTSFDIDSKTFTEQIPQIMDAINQLNSLMDNIGQPIRISGQDNTYRGVWINADLEEKV